MLNSRKLQVLILIGILAASSAGGWVILLQANELAKNRSQGPFSQERLAADKAFKIRDYVSAAGYFREMTIKDPYNCWAQLYLGRCLLEQILDDIAKKSEADSGLLAELAASDETGLAGFEIRDAWIAEAFAAFRAGAELRILKAACEYHIARLHYLQNDHESAIEVLASVPPGESRFQRTMERDFADMSDRADFQELLALQKAKNLP